MKFPAPAKKPFLLACEDKAKQKKRILGSPDQQGSRSCGRSSLSSTGITAGLAWWRCASIASWELPDGASGKSLAMLAEEMVDQDRRSRDIDGRPKLNAGILSD